MGAAGAAALIGEEAVVGERGEEALDEAAEVEIEGAAVVVVEIEGAAVGAARLDPLPARGWIKPDRRLNRRRGGKDVSGRRAFPQTPRSFAPKVTHVLAIIPIVAVAKPGRCKRG